jgi:hypothetical protein
MGDLLIYLLLVAYCCKCCVARVIIGELRLVRWRLYLQWRDFDIDSDNRIAVRGDSWFAAQLSSASKQKSVFFSAVEFVPQGDAEEAASRP